MKHPIIGTLLAITTFILKLQYYTNGFSLFEYFSELQHHDTLSEQLRKLKRDFNPINIDEINSLVTSFAKQLEVVILKKKVPVDLIVRVPGHDELIVNTTKPIHLIAGTLATALNIPFAEYYITKAKVTNPRRQINRKNLLQNAPILSLNNLFNSFKITGDYAHFENKNILVFDDVITTGATLSEVGRTISLRRNFNTLYYFTLAKGKNIHNETMPLLTHRTYSP